MIQNCSVLALFRFVVGPHFLKQSHAKPKPITTLLPAFSAFLVVWLVFDFLLALQSISVSSGWSF